MCNNDSVLRGISQLIAGVSINGNFVDFSILHGYFTIRVDVFFLIEI